jgi:sugar O-acyltransferase (sialic acid O-acetyltransferase NeuD family)
MTNISRKLIVVGAGGHAASVYGIALSLGYEIKMFIHDGKHGQTLFHLPVIRDLSLVENLKDYEFFVAIGDNTLREHYVNSILSIFPNANFPNLVHPSVILLPFSKIGRGTIIMPNSVIGTNVSVGEFCILGSLTAIGHDSILHNFSFVGPSASLAGNVRLGFKSIIGIGAVVREKVTIGSNSLVGASSFINKDLDDDKKSISGTRNLISNRFSEDI